MTDSPEWWLIFVILAIWEGETEELQVPGQHGLYYKTTPLDKQQAWEAAQWQSRKAPSPTPQSKSGQTVPVYEEPGSLWDFSRTRGLDKI